MWSIDWFTARSLALAGTPIRRIAWNRGLWLVYAHALWWVRNADLTWNVVANTQFGEDEFRARDWTSEPYTADICGSLPAYNETAQPETIDWGDVPIMQPRPIPNYPDDLD